MWGLKQISGTPTYSEVEVQSLSKILVTFMSDIDSPKGKGKKSFNRHLIVQL